MTRRSSTGKVAVVGAVAALALSACGSSTTTPQVNAASKAQIGYRPVPYAQVGSGGTLNLSATESPTDAGNWNADTSEGAEEDAIQIEAPTSCSLIEMNADGSWKADPDYASSITLVSKNPQVVEVKLNPKAVWQDGSPITSSDFRATFAALSGKNKAYDLASSAGYNQVSNFQVVSPTEFKVTFATTYADWPSLFGEPLPASIASDPQAWNKGYTNKPLPSCGPFVYSKIDNNAKIYSLVPNPKWWGRTPKLAGITFKVIADSSAQAQAFVNGELNAVEVDQDVDSYKTALTKAGAVVERSAGLTWSHVTLNGDKWPTNDVHVRQAIAHALNRTLVAKTANAPVGFPAVTQGSYIFMPGQAGYKDTVGKNLNYSPAKAMSILKADGWAKKNGHWYKGGKELTLQLTITQSAATEVQRGAIITSALAAIGIPVKYNNVPSADLFNDIYNGEFNMATFSWVGTPFPISSTESIFYPAMKPGDFNGQNLAFVTDPRLGTLWKQANSTLDPAKRIKIAQQIDNVLTQYVPLVPFAPSPQIDVVDKNVANYGPTEFLSRDWTQIGFTKAAGS